MPVIFAYMFVVFIWATTPLAIQWSNSSLDFIAAVTLRLLLALALCVVSMWALRFPLVKSRRDWLAFAAGAIGLYPNMLIVYWSAQYLSSGLMAVLLGLYPFAVGFFSLLLLKENVFNPMRIIALFIALLGLAIINLDQIALGSDATYGVLGMASSSLLFALSTVWLKALGGAVNPLRQSTGMLLLASPAFLLTWFFLDGQVPQQIDMKSMLGVAYLAIAGSVLGYTLFFYVLRHCSIASVSLIPLITPVLALSIGAVVAREQVSLLTLAGACSVLLALMLYQNIFGLLFNAITRRRLAGRVPGTVSGTEVSKRVRVADEAVPGPVAE
ncbi:DMT family transporter [Teredinibacter turnerae]|uniref:DMT family transporter n=1 Tax=Teredinibacter turnerae TaxID=2426 RepID=UPI00037E5CC7|nr:DMT family transporter [Teredinibacter turnerae]